MSKISATCPDESADDVSYAWRSRLTKPGGVTLDFCSDRESRHGRGVRFEGDAGWVHVVRGGIRAEPASLLDTVLQPSDQRIFALRDHQWNFIECRRTRRERVAPAEAGRRAMTAALTALQAYETGASLRPARTLEP